MAEEIAREIVSQSRSMLAHKPLLAFKFEQGVGKCLILSTFKESGEKMYHMTWKVGVNKRTVKYQTWNAAYEVINAYVGGDCDTPLYQGIRGSVEFKFVSVNKGDVMDLLDFRYYWYAASNNFSQFLKEKLTFLDADPMES